MTAKNTARECSPSFYCRCSANQMIEITGGGISSPDRTQRLRPYKTNVDISHSPQHTLLKIKYHALFPLFQTTTR
jgi:hypothetical protein